MSLLTAGCGISQYSFPYWPTWVKYPEITHHLNHINIGGPASGNEYLAHNIVKNLQDIEYDCAIIMWTSHSKTDLFIESQHIVDEIKTYDTRNFVLNNKGLVVDTAPAWWPSSVSGDNRIKDWINNNIFSDLYQLEKTLMCITSVQRALERNRVKYYMFFGYNIPLEHANSYGIDLNKFVTQESLYDNYYSSYWTKYSTTKQYGLVPVAGWHWDFYKKHIYKILNKYFQKKNIDLDKMNKAVLEVTKKNFKKGIS